MNLDNAFCVILAGGKGRRLWPCSRQKAPKQFDDFFGEGRTQLQQTYDRFANLLPASHIYIITNIDYLHFVKEQLPDVASENILSEPVHRNTVPSLAWASYRILQQNKDACILVSPSDQAVENISQFETDVKQAFSRAEQVSGLICMGVRPTRPEPGYGYIQQGDEVKDGIYRVKSFTEKPEREFARIFMESGEFYWNTGIFVAQIDFLRTCFDRILPDVLRHRIAQGHFASLEEEYEYMEENFPRYPNVSIERGILEPLYNVYLLPCKFGWADLGTWHSIYEALQKSPEDNVSINSDVHFENAKGNVVKLPSGKFAVISGLENYIVAEKDNVLLICPKEDSSASIRKYINEVQLKKDDSYI